MDLTIEQQVSEIYQWMKELRSTSTQQLKEVVKDPWIKEKDAAELMGRAPRTLRKKCISNEWNIHFRVDNGRRYEYKKEDILRHKQNTSTE